VVGFFYQWSKQIMKTFYELYKLLEACAFNQANLRHVQDLEKKNLSASYAILAR